MRCPLGGRYVSKTKGGSASRRDPTDKFRTGVNLLDYDASLVEQGAAGDQQVDQVLPETDLVSDHLGFRLDLAIEGVADVELKAGAKLVLLVGGIQVLVGEFQRHLGQLDRFLAGLDVGDRVEHVQPDGLLGGAQGRGVLLFPDYGVGHVGGSGSRV